MIAAKVLFWSSLGALAWTQLGYPLFAAALARVRSRPVRKSEFTPSVSLIVAAHDEEDVIERRLENLLTLDYPREQPEQRRIPDVRVYEQADGDPEHQLQHRQEPTDAAGGRT